MIAQFSRWLETTLAVCLLISVCACNDSGGGDSPSPTVDVTGHWSGRSSVGINFTMDLTQNGANVTGKTTGGGETGDMVGTVDGNTFSFTQIWPVSGESTGEATVDGDSMNGSVTENHESASFTATRN